LLSSNDYLRQHAASIASGEIEQLKSVRVVVSDPRRAALLAFALPAVAELALFKLLPALGGDEYLGSFDASGMPDEMSSTFIATGFDSTGIWKSLNLSPGFLRRYERGSQKHGKASYDQNSFLQSHLLSKMCFYSIPTKHRSLEAVKRQAGHRFSHGRGS
jgi:hypothetical protein